MFRRTLVVCALLAAPLLCSLSGCGRGEPDLTGTWHLDAARTLATLGTADAAAVEKTRALFGTFEVRFGEEQVRIRINDREVESGFHLRSATGDHWALGSQGGDLNVRWIDGDTILFDMTDAPDATRAGLMLVRR